MSKLYAVLSLFLISNFLFINDAKATHAQGADISYECIGNNQYKIIYQFYWDCTGQVSEPTSPSFAVTSSCGGTTFVTLNKDLAYPNNVEVSQLCSSATSTCNGGTYPGVKQFTYTGIVTLTPGCIYTVGYGEGSRNTSTNLLNSGNYNLYVETTINTVIPNLCNNAPVFTSLPVPYYCLNQTYNYSHGAYDIDGDSLVYSLVAPLQDNGTVIAYVSPFSPTNPMPTASGFIFDTQTGQMTFNPTSVGKYVVTVQVDEYRNGVKIGSTMRDIQIQVINCNNAPPIVRDSLSYSNVTGGTVIDKNSIGACPGATISFNITAYDPTKQPLTIVSNIATSIPGATLTTTPLPGLDSVRLTFSWTPSPSDSGFRYFTLTVKDNQCPITGNQTYTYDITVLRGVNAGPDKGYCPLGGSVQVQVTGGSKFSWTTLAGGPPVGIVSASIDSGLVSFAPSVTTTYVVKSNLTGGCKDKDTITIKRVADFQSKVTVDDDTICLYGSSTLTVHASPASEGPYTYVWTPTSSILSQVDSNITVNPSTTTMYKVQITSKDGCVVVRDSAKIVISGVGPRVLVFSDKNYVCPGDTITLTPSISATICGLTPGGINAACPGGSSFASDTVGNGNGNNTDVTPYRGFFQDGRVQYLFRASELQASGMKAGTITDLSFFVTSVFSSGAYNGFSIKMGCTALNQLGSTFQTGLQTVVNANSYIPFVGTNSHVFDSPFDWDGFSNLIVEVCFDNSSYTDYDEVATSTAFAGATLMDETDNSVGCNLATPSAYADRPNIVFGTCTPPIVGYNFLWSTISGSSPLNCPICQSPKVGLASNTSYLLKVSDASGCNGSATIDLFVNADVAISAGNDTAVCGTPVQLNVAQTNPKPPVCVQDYSVSSIPYNSLTPSGSTNTVTWTGGGSADDGYSPVVTIPFSFNFYCQAYTQLIVSTNGYITLGGTPPPTGTYGTPAIPNTAVPNNVIALSKEDLSLTASGNVTYFTSGTAPNRIFVIRWTSVPHYASTTNKVSGEIQLFEGTNVVEIHTSSNNSTATHIQGLENGTGTVGNPSPGRNSQTWTVSTPDAYRFTPQYNGVSITSINWNPSAGLSSTTIANPYANPPASSCYVASVAYTNGCVVKDTVCVNVSTFPHSVDVSPDTICPGDQAQLSFTGAGVKYVWSPSSLLTDSTLPNPKATVINTTKFFVVATNQGGCSVKDSVTLYTFPQKLVTLPADVVVCPQDSITISPSGGSYDFVDWFSVATGNTIISSSPSLVAKPNNSFYVRVKNAGNTCYAYSDTFTINSQVINPLVASQDAAICQGESVTLSVSPTTYTSYVWSNSTLGVTNTVSQSGGYYVTALSGNCPVISNTVNIIVAPPPVVSFVNIKNPICDGDTVTLSAGLETGVTYTWTPGGIADTILVTQPGHYFVQAQVGNCVDTGSIDLIPAVPPTVSLPPSFDTCSCIFSHVIQPTVSGTMKYLWSPTNDSTASITITTSGTYTVKITDANNCTASASQTIGVNCLKVDAGIVEGSSQAINQGDTTRLIANTSGSNYQPSLTYLWQPSSSLFDSLKKQVTAQPTATTTYTVYVIDDLYGCRANDTITIGVIPPGKFALPTGFTPNGDNQNDYFYPYFPQGSTAYVVSLRIYDRWGQLVYSGANAPGWDGKVGGIDAPVDTYTYYIEVAVLDPNNPSGVTKTIKAASFALIR